MKYKKGMIILIMAVFLASIAGVCASDVNDTTVASEDANQIEVSSNDVLVGDKLQTSEENTTLTQASDDETVSAESDSQTLTAGEGTYYNLRDEIGNGGNKNLARSYYKYTGGNTIEITTSGVINGNGAVIDMAGSNIRAFYVSASGVTIKNLTIKNANFNDGGAVYFDESSTATVSNCNFINCSASLGGAIYFKRGMNRNSVINCNFANNNASSEGGAIYCDEGSQVDVKNCNFTNNNASSEGGAIYFAKFSYGIVTNCNFTDNSAAWGGAIYFNSGVSSNVINCNFANNNASSAGGAVYFNEFSVGSVSSCNFAGNKAGFSGAIYFGYEGSVTNCNFTGNNATTGSAIYFYMTMGPKSVSNSIFLNNRANSEALEVTKNDNNIKIIFTGNDNLLNAIYSRGDVSFTNVTYWGANGITNTDDNYPSRSNKEVGQNITVKGIVNGNIINAINVTDENGEIVLGGDGDYWIIVRHDGDSYYTEAERIFTNIKLYVNVTEIKTNNRTVNITAKSNIQPEIMPGKLTFILPDAEINATYAADGIWWAEYTFDDYADYQVNASYIGLSNVIIKNAIISVIKANSTLTISGNIAFDYNANGSATVYFTNASGVVAEVVGQPNAIVVVNDTTITVSGLDAGNYTLAVTTIVDENHNNVTKTADITVNKIDSALTVNDVTLDYGAPAKVTVSTEGATGITAKINDVDVVVENNTIVIPVLDAGTYTLTVTTISDANHNNVTKTANITVNKIDSALTVNDVSLDYGAPAKVTVSTEGATGITAKINDVDVVVENNTIVIPVLDAGTYTLTVTTITDANHNNITKNATITVNKAKTQLTADEVITTYNTNKYLVITLKDVNGNPISGLNITVDLNGDKNYTTDTSGQVKISTKGLAANIYEVLISFNGTENYLNCSNTTRVIIYKESSKVDAKPLTTVYNVHKYLVVGLKDKDGNPIRNADAYMEINGVNYKCRSDDKGNARLIIRLNPNKYTAKITFDNVNYTGFTQYVTVIVKKATPKLTAKKKTFKKAKKVKKYTVTLKDNNGKAMAKVKLTLKVKGKTYKAKTNAKGEAVFKIKKLTQKGKYKATVRFAGNKCYNKVTKKVKITVK